MAANRFKLELLPDALLFEIINYLSPTDAAIVVMLCKATLQQAKSLDNDGFYTPSPRIDFRSDHIRSNLFFNSRIFIAQENLKQAGLCILQGKKDNAFEMIDSDPELLLQVIPTITLKKYPGHIGETHIGRTLYQLALGTYDYELYEPIGQCIELKYGHAVKAKQFNEQFPEGVKSKKSYRALFDLLIKTMLADLTIDFVDGKNIMNNATRELLETLETRLGDELKQHTTGVHFDLQIVIDFIDADKEGFGKSKNLKQRGLYWRCGFGNLESFMSYFVAMAFNEKKHFDGLMEGKRKKQVTRSTILRDNSDLFDLTLGESHYTIAGYCLNDGGVVVAELLKYFAENTLKKLDDLSSNCNNQHTLTNRK